MGTNANPLRSHSTLHQLTQRKLETRSQLGTNESGRPIDAAARECRISFNRGPIGETEDGVLDSAKGTWQWDIKNDVTTWSEQLYGIIGRDRSAGVPAFRQHSTFYTSGSWDLLLNATIELLHTGVPYELKVQMLHIDGTRRWVMVRAEAVRDDHGDLLQLRGTVEDISESRRQAARNGRELQGRTGSAHTVSGRLIHAQEEYNSKIAGNLRDNICQRASMLAVWIQSLNSTLPGLSPKVEFRLEELWQYTTELLTELDQVADELYPSYLDLLGLKFAVTETCRQFTRRTGIAIECGCTDIRAENLDRHIALAVFRVLEEALANIARHSHAKNAAVKVSQNSMELILQLSDDGVGFDETTCKAATGLGFLHMKERLRQIGGSLAVWSQPGCGTSIEVRGPLRGNERGDSQRPRLLIRADSNTVLG